MIREAMTGTKPSVKFRMNVYALTNSCEGFVTPGDESFLKSLAWKAVLKTLPADFRTLINLLHITEFPDAPTLEQIDTSWILFYKNSTPATVVVESSGDLRILGHQLNSH